VVGAVVAAGGLVAATVGALVGAAVGGAVVGAVVALGAAVGGTAVGGTGVAVGTGVGGVAQAARATANNAINVTMSRVLWDISLSPFRLVVLLASCRQWVTNEISAASPPLRSYRLRVTGLQVTGYRAKI
jgi:hypothetical protein